jgi:hypothetical protein
MEQLDLTLQGDNSIHKAWEAEEQCLIHNQGVIVLATSDSP